MSEQKITEPEAKSHVLALVGERSWGAKLGADRMLTIEFGAPAETYTTRSGKRVVHGELHLWLYGCAWRVREMTGGRLLGGSDDADDVREKCAAEVNDGEVSEVRLSGVDLALFFKNGRVLETFGLCTDEDHWLLWLPDRQVLTAGPNNELTLAERET